MALQSYEKFLKSDFYNTAKTTWPQLVNDGELYHAAMFLSNPIEYIPTMIGTFNNLVSEGKAAEAAGYMAKLADIFRRTAPDINVLYNPLYGVPMDLLYWLQINVMPELSGIIVKINIAKDIEMYIKNAIATYKNFPTAAEREQYAEDIKAILNQEGGDNWLEKLSDTLRLEVFKTILKKDIEQRQAELQAAEAAAKAALQKKIIIGGILGAGTLGALMLLKK